MAPPKKKKGSSIDIPDKINEQSANLERLAEEGARSRAEAPPPDLAELKELVQAVDPKDIDPAEMHRQITKQNRNRGKAAEREVARLFDCERVVGSVGPVDPHQDTRADMLAHVEGVQHYRGQLIGERAFRAPIHDLAKPE